MENLFKNQINPIDLSSSTSFYRYGIEQPHLPVIKYCIDHVKFPGNFVEFGVWTGISTKFIAKQIAPLNLYAFDSFEGLSEDWNNLKKGMFKVDLNTLEFPANVLIQAGEFKDTIPNFVENHKERISFINIDCDLYSSTKLILEKLNHLIFAGTIIYFDELYNYPDFQNGEYKALLEWLHTSNRFVRPIAFNDDKGIAVEVLK